MSNIWPKCVICGNSPECGLYDGLRLAKKFICSKCAAQINHIELGTDEYQALAQNIKQILFPEGIEWTKSGPGTILMKKQ
jgi:hypothetical protein